MTFLTKYQNSIENKQMLVLIQALVLHLVLGSEGHVYSYHMDNKKDAFNLK